MAKFQSNPNAIGLSLLRRISSSGVLEKTGLKAPFEKMIYEGSRRGFQAGAAGSRAFKAVKKLGKPQRPETSGSPTLFDLTPNDEQAMIRDSVARYAVERLRAAAHDADTACAAPQEIVAGAAELGLAMMSVPEALEGGGSDMSPVTGALIAEAMAHGDMGLAIACLAPVGVANLLTRYGSAEQQASYLAPFAEELPPAAALAILEPEPLFDPATLRTQAHTRGDKVILSGEKSLVPLAETAEVFLVAAADSDGKPQIYIVESKAKGLTVKADPGMGIRAASLGSLHFDKVELPASAKLGEAKGCDYYQVLALSRLAWCAMAVGTGQAVLDYVIPYVNERQAFGEPISNRQSVAFMVADMALELEGMRLATWRAAALAEQGKAFNREAAVAHNLCSRHGMQIGSNGVQLLGGHGFVKEHPVERWYRDLRAVGVMHGGVCL